MFEQGTEAGDPIDIGDEIRQPDRRHGRGYPPCECDRGLGFDCSDGGNPQAFGADPGIAPACFQLANRLAEFLIEHFCFLGEIDPDVDRNGNGNAGFGLDDGVGLLRDHVLVKRPIGVRTLDPYLVGGDPVLQFDDQKEFQHLPVDRAIRSDDFLAPAPVRQQQRLVDPGLLYRPEAGLPCRRHLHDNIDEMGVLAVSFEGEGCQERAGCAHIGPADRRSDRRRRASVWLPLQRPSPG